mmetsp:Transcript_14844/g.18669  ORF Transcript_14844/g.18669 Transcript_14844/m.18669 type:complete len:96 (+) Transcript_14844:58-345(+)
MTCRYLRLDCFLAFRHYQQTTTAQQAKAHQNSSKLTHYTLSTLPLISVATLEALSTIITQSLLNFNQHNLNKTKTSTFFQLKNQNSPITGDVVAL